MLAFSLIILSSASDWNASEQVAHQRDAVLTPEQ